MSHTPTDEVDRRIVRALIRNGRASHRSIASEVGVAASTVSNRLADMEAAGAIEGYEPLLDYGKFGYPVTAIVHLRTTGGLNQEANTTADGDSQPDINSAAGDDPPADAETGGLPVSADGLWTQVHRVTGSFDYVTIGHFPHHRAVAEAIVELRAARSVLTTRTEFVVETLFDHPPMPIP